MGFSGSGSSATRAHTHDSTIINDGGSLNFDNITQGGAAMTAGAITYSDGAAGHMQVLTIGNAGESLVTNAGATAPEWAASSDPHNSGMLTCWAGTAGAGPAGWLLCDGASVATATYPDLFTAIGYTYGGAGANFNLPNLVDVFVRGQSTQTAATGGADSLTLSTAQMPTHTHTVNDGGHTHDVPSHNLEEWKKSGGAGGSTSTDSYQQENLGLSIYNPNDGYSWSNLGINNTGTTPYRMRSPATTTDSNTTGITNNDTGSSNSFDNRPAYLEMMYIIKT